MYRRKAFQATFIIFATGFLIAQAEAIGAGLLYVNNPGLVEALGLSQQSFFIIGNWIVVIIHTIIIFFVIQWALRTAGQPDEKIKNRQRLDTRDVLAQLDDTQVDELQRLLDARERMSNAH